MARGLSGYTKQLFESLAAMSPEERELCAQECLETITATQKHAEKRVVLSSNASKLSTVHDDMDRFMHQTCSASEKGCVRMSKLYGKYVEWQKGRGLEPVSSIGFGRTLSSKGYKIHRSGGSVLRGLSIVE